MERVNGQHTDRQTTLRATSAAAGRIHALPAEQADCLTLEMFSDF